MHLIGLVFHSQLTHSGFMMSGTRGQLAPVHRLTRGAGVEAGRPDRRIGARELGPLLSGWRDQASGLPDYQALADRIRLLVLDGRVPVHAVLPSERALAGIAQTSRTTTTAAYRALRESGFARGAQGAGTWTTLPAAQRGRPAVDPWPVVNSAYLGTPDGAGDLQTAAPEAPAQLYTAYAAALAELPRFLPGHGYLTGGLPDLRAAIARRYTERGLPTDPDQVLVTAGALHALRLVAGALISPGDRVLVEHPCYPPAVDLLRRAGARTVAWPVEDGWDIEEGRAALAQATPRLAYLMPEFQNPTGRLMPTADREPLVAALGRSGCVAVVDETTADLDLRADLRRADSAPGTECAAPDNPPALAALARPGAVVCLGSASKTVWGGLRLGWVRADPALIRRLAAGRAGDDLGSPVVEQLAAAYLLEHCPELVGERRALMAGRYLAMRDAFARHLPDWQLPAPDGGLVTWARLPQPRSSALAAAAGQFGIRLTPGPRFGVDGGFESRIRLPFCRPAEHYQAIAERVAQAWRARGRGGVAEPDHSAVV
jgi:DNA-binding transcriptional MocR family regulator